MNIAEFFLFTENFITFSIRDCDRFDTDSIDMKKEKTKNLNNNDLLKIVYLCPFLFQSLHDPSSLTNF